MGGDGGTAGEGGSGGTSGAGAGAGGAGTGGMGVSCVRSAFIECQGTAAVRCASNGRDRSTQDCGVPGCNASQKRCNVCTPGETFCADPATLATCGPEGLASSDETCEEGCNSAVSPAICNHCEPGISFCLDADTVRSCDSQSNAQQDTGCPNGCTPTSSTAAQCNQCTPGEVLGCADASHQSRCKSDGSGAETVDCAEGCSGDGVCNVCAPDSKTCTDANTLTTCNADGTSTSEMQCTFGCLASACNVCSPSTTECQDNKLVVCSAAGTVTSSNTCTYGCDATADPDTCKSPTLVPSNLYDATVTLMPANPCETATLVDLSVPAAGSLMIDTDGAVCTRVKTQAGSLPAICVVVQRNITFAETSSVTVTGSRALALVATGTMSVSGRINASAVGSNAGPGAMVTGLGVGANGISMPSGSESAPGNAGGGGGGFGANGGPGGDAPGACNTSPCADPGAGGLVQGPNTTLIPLRAGSRGGFNSANSGSIRQGFPGGGGGAVQLVGCNTLTIANSAEFDANGGGGGGGVPGADGPSATPGAGAGGGSGGAFLIEAQSTSISSGAQFYANGGSGGGGATLVNGGVSGAPGVDGTRGTMAAIGGSAANTAGSTSFAGGNGGATSNTGSPIAASAGGGPAADSMSAAGGGGGGVGRFRINNTAGNLGGSILNASPNIGLSMNPNSTMVGTINACADAANPIGPCLR